jgi:hypothetical protein
MILANDDFSLIRCGVDFKKRHNNFVPKSEPFTKPHFSQIPELPFIFNTSRFAFVSLGGFF